MPDRILAARSERGFLFAASAIVLGFLVLAWVRPGQSEMPFVWGGDVIQYIMHAQAIAEGRAYTDIPYIFNPERSWIGPQTYPPAVPLYLAIPVMIHGPDPTVIGLYKIPLMAGVVIFTILICRQYLPGHWGLIPGFLFAINPLVTEITVGILSEPLFTFFAMITLFLGNRLLLKGRPFPALNALGLSASVVATISARTVGIVLFPALVLFGALRHRRVDYRTMILTLIISAGLYFVMTNLIADPLQDYTRAVERMDYDKQDIGLLQFLMITLRDVVWRLRFVPPAISSAWVQAPAGPILLVFSALCFVLITVGFLMSVFRQIRFSDVFYVGYIGLLLVAPFGVNTRLLFPILPLTLIYLTVGIFHAGGLAVRLCEGRGVRLAHGVRTVVPPLLVLPVIVMLVISRFDVGHVSPERSPYDRYAKSMAAFIDSHVPRDAILVSSRPRIMYHLTGRVGSPPPFPLREKATVAWMKRLSARYLLLISEDFATPPEKFEIVHTEGYLKLYVLRNARAKRG